MAISCPEYVTKSFLFLFPTASICGLFSEVFWDLVCIGYMFGNWQFWKPLYVAAEFCGQLGAANRQAAVLTLLFGFFALGTCVCLVRGLVCSFLCMYFPPSLPRPLAYAGVNRWNGFISCAGLVKVFFHGLQ